MLITMLSYPIDIDAIGLAALGKGLENPAPDELVDETHMSNDQKNMKQTKHAFNTTLMGFRRAAWESLPEKERTPEGREHINLIMEGAIKKIDLFEDDDANNTLVEYLRPYCRNSKS
jgi:hypothetical protein